MLAWKMDVKPNMMMMMMMKLIIYNADTVYFIPMKGQCCYILNNYYQITSMLKMFSQRQKLVQSQQSKSRTKFNEPCFNVIFLTLSMLLLTKCTLHAHTLIARKFLVNN